MSAKLSDPAAAARLAALLAPALIRATKKSATATNGNGDALEVSRAAARPTPTLAS